MLSLRDALDQAITKQLFTDIPRAKIEGEFAVVKIGGPGADINVDALVDVVLAVIRDNAG